MEFFWLIYDLRPENVNLILFIYHATLSTKSRWLYIQIQNIFSFKVSFFNENLEKENLDKKSLTESDTPPSQMGRSIHFKISVFVF